MLADSGGSNRNCNISATWWKSPLEQKFPKMFHFNLTNFNI